jgi:NSS family neurotransmitter:Na+ symporter
MARRGKWGSKIGFILAASGSAVGLGNLWRFPYTAGENGGGVFVFFYLLSILLIALPVLLAEISLGRFTGKNPVGAFNAIRPGGPWKLVGYLGVLTGFMILSYYAVVAGWAVGYFVKAVTGKFRGIDFDRSKEMFSSFSADAPLQLLLLAFFIFLTVYIVSRGVSGGIEKFSKILMPVLFGILLLLLLRSLTLKGATAGLVYYLKPDFSKLKLGIILAAMGQAFFSMSLGMGTMITYGSYVDKKENLPSSAGWIAFFDTFIAILAGVIIFPAIFSQGISPDQGAGVMFNVLPVLFSKMPLGYLFGPLFFLLLSIAALTSTISVLEVPVAYFIDERKWNRKRAAYVIGFITLLVGVPSALSEKFFGLWDFLWGNLSLSIGALFIAIFVGWMWKTGRALEEISKGAGKFRLALFWKILIKFITPLLILAILLGLII